MQACCTASASVLGRRSGDHRTTMIPTIITNPLICHGICADGGTNRESLKKPQPQIESVFWNAGSNFRNALTPAPRGPNIRCCRCAGMTAWGRDTQFIWCWRPLDQSIAGLQRRGWFPGSEESLQQRLWDALNDFDSRHGGVARLDWAQVQSDPVEATRQLARLAGLERSDDQLLTAARFIRTSA